MADWENVDAINAGRGGSFSFGRTSPVLIFGILMIISPWILDIMFNVPCWLKSFLNVLGIFLVVIGAVLSMVDR